MAKNKNNKHIQTAKPVEETASNPTVTPAEKPQNLT